MKPNKLRNEYWLLRHGQSLANEVETIISKPEHGIDERWTLAPGGEDQARAAGVKFGEVVQAAERGGRTVRVYSSPFSRTRRTASLAAEAAGLQADTCPIQVAPELRERFFGDELEMQPYSTAYGKIWERDEVSTASVPGGNGESVDEVSARIRQLFERLEDGHKDAIILLVSHGDTLSILQTTMLGEDTKQHRRFAFNTAELRPLIAPGPGLSTGTSIGRPPSTAGFRSAPGLSFSPNGNPMPGKFKFLLDKPEKFNQAAYLEAIHETRKLKPPADIYVAYGPEDMGMAMVIKAQHRQEWNLVLPTDPNKYDLECGFTYGITSRREIWDFVRQVLLGVCRSSRGAFVLEWEDGDLGDVVETGSFDPDVGDIVVCHRGCGLPSVNQLNRGPAAMPRPGSGSWH